MPGTVTTTGSSSVPAQPDRAVVTLQVTAMEVRADAALADVTARSGELSSAIRSLNVRDEDLVTGGVTVAEQKEWRDGHEVSLGFRATTITVVNVRDVGVLGQLL